jgi:hypothetical protein
MDVMTTILLASTAAAMTNILDRLVQDLGLLTCMK